MLLSLGLLLFLTSVAGIDAWRTGLEGWDGGSVEWKNFALQRRGGGGGRGLGIPEPSTSTLLF